MFSFTKYHDVRHPNDHHNDAKFRYRQPFWIRQDPIAKYHDVKYPYTWIHQVCDYARRGNKYL